MSRIEVIRTIHAPAANVFQTVSDIREFSKALPHVVNYEFLSDLQTGTGARFRETRLMNGKEATTELEVTEYVKDDHVRMVADSGGAIWDSLFQVTTKGDQTVLSMTMDAKPYQFLSKVMTFLFKGMIKKAVEKDMDLVKTFCEQSQKQA